MLFFWHCLSTIMSFENTMHWLDNWPTLKNLRLINDIFRNQGGLHNFSVHGSLAPPIDKNVIQAPPWHQFTSTTEFANALSRRMLSELSGLIIKQICHLFLLFFLINTDMNGRFRGKTFLYWESNCKCMSSHLSSGPCGRASTNCTDVKLAAILQLSQYCTFDGDSISTVITEPGQPVTSSSSPGLGSILHLLK